MCVPAVLIEGSRLKPPRILPTLLVNWTTELLPVSRTKTSMLPSTLPPPRLLTDQKETRVPLPLITGWLVIPRLPPVERLVKFVLVKQGVLGAISVWAATGSTTTRLNSHAVSKAKTQ